MKTKLNPSGFFVLFLISITLVSLFTIDMNSSYSCELGDYSDESVANSRDISVDMVQLLRTQRGLTNPEICTMPQDKLDRAIFRSEHPKPDHPNEAALFRVMQNQDENGEIPADGISKALEQIERMPTVSLIPQGSEDAIITPDTLPADGPSPLEIPGENAHSNIAPADWTWKGPGNIGGRVRSIVIHPTQTDRMWAGAVSGGIWYTSNAGASWAPVDDFMLNLAVSTLIIDPTNSNILYAGTGEGFYNADAIRGAGVFKSTDGGVSWSQLSATANSSWYWVNRLAISPNGTTLLAATRTGIWRSTNGGSTWTNVNADIYVKDVDFDPVDNLKAVAGSADCKAYYSTNGGQTWTPASGLPACSDWLNRVEVAYAPSNGSYVYATVNINSGEVWRSTNGGQSYSLRNTGNNFLGNQGWYDNVVWVDPTNVETIVVGGIDLWRSTNGGSSLTKISQWQYAPASAHADHHAIVQHPNFNGTTNRIVFFGNDGGIYKANNVYTVEGTTGWTELNNQLGITQFYGAAGNVSSGVIVGGTQDNGTLRYSGNSEGWTQMYGGDGGFCAADPTNSNYFYGEYVYLTIHRSTNAGLSSSYVYSGISDANNSATANFIAPFILDPNNANTMLAGGVSLWRSNNIKAGTPGWSSIKASDGNKISAIAVASGNSNIIWVGHNNGNVYRTSNGTAAAPTWTRVDETSPLLPNRYVHRITIDSNDHNKVYVSFGAFSADNIYRTTNNGANWMDITGTGGTGLPNVPVRSLAIHPDDSQRLFVGTEVGIFASEDGGANWGVPQAGPANVSVDELFWMDRVLVAATHGRGIYEINLGQSVEIEHVSVQDENYVEKTVFQPGEVIRWVIAVQNKTSTDATAQLTWDVRASNGELVKYWQGNITVPTGLSGWQLIDTVGDIRGTHTFTGTVNYQGRVTQKVINYTVPTQVLLVDDDDNSPDVRGYYTETLGALNLSYDIWDTGNSDNEPGSNILSAYSAVIWFSGDAYGGPAGPGVIGESALAAWLDQNGGCLMISSQDYLYDKGLTTFMQNYLGVETAVSDESQSSVTGQSSVFGGLGPYSLSFPFSNYSDRLTPDSSAELAFSGNNGDAAVDKSNGSYKTTYWGFPFETLPTAGDRQNAMSAFLRWCGSLANNIYLPLIVKD